MSRRCSPMLQFSLLGLALMGLLACGSTEDTPSGFMGPGPIEENLPSDQLSNFEGPDAVTMANVVLLREALEVWADTSPWQTSHYYPPTSASQTLDGASLWDLLPEGLLFVNAYTGERTEPRWKSTDQSPGSISWVTLVGDTGDHDCYEIKVFGIDGLIWHLKYQYRRWAVEEDRTRMNGLIVRRAVEDWSWENGGLYPQTLNHPNTAGHTVIDLLPHGRLIENAFPDRPMVPSDYFPGRPGEIGYVVIETIDGDGVGYGLHGLGGDGIREIFVFSPSIDPDDYREVSLWINPRGFDRQEITLRNAVAARSALEQWIRENDGGHPTSVVEPNQLGHTMIDLLPAGVLLRNSYTGEQSEPRDGLALEPGQVGYFVSPTILVGDQPTVMAFGDAAELWLSHPRTPPTSE